MAKSIIRNCEQCGKPFKAYAYSVKLGFGRFCCMPCFDAFRTSRLALRFWSKVKIGLPEECWIWQAGVFTDGYGAFCRGRQNIHASRVAYELTHGLLPSPEVVVRHTCDTPLCVNPNHLIPGSNADNSRDTAERGRAYQGERHHLARLTEQAVKSIRAEYAAGISNQTALAEKHGVSQSAIWNLLRGRTWKRVA